ncbi:MAG TPA: hypothetical protein VFI46_06665 [Jiangellaceae bacterium]|nr:hypothetical protein [Jiangellaceae bacterium]
MSDDVLIDAAERLHAHGIEATPTGAAAVAGLLAHSECGRPGTNVAILTGR